VETTLFCSKYIQDTAYHILSQSAELYRKYDKNISAYIFLRHGVQSTISTTARIYHVRQKLHRYSFPITLSSFALL